MQIVNLNETVDGIKEILTLLTSETIDLKFALCDSLGNILADAGQIEQLILNMAVNARDAMQEGGSLRISTWEVLLTGGDGLQLKDIPAGLYAVLEFAGTGEGRLDTVRERLSEPHIATRHSDGKTGLGLSSILDIVIRHKGFIERHDESGRGSAYRLYFPITNKKSDGEASREIPLPVCGTATILAVDDNAAMRSLIREALEPLGYKVLVAASGDDALEISRTKNEKIDLLLTDVVMPGMSGRQLISRLQSERPALKAILMSGYPADIVGPNSMLEPHLNFISKPFVQAELVRKINQVLEE